MFKISCNIISEDNEPDIILETFEKEVKELYNKHGLKVLSRKWLKQHYKNYSKAFYGRITTNNLRLTIRGLAIKFGVLEQWLKQRADNQITNTGKVRWSKEKIDNTIREIIEKYGCIPSHAFLRNNGYNTFCTHVSLTELRKKYNLPVKLSLISLDGKLWDSMAECSCANFLIARGINVIKGLKYDQDYKSITGHNAFYDMHFIANNGEFTDKKIDIEIWGGHRGPEEENYKNKRKQKEDFNKTNTLFMGIDYRECYSDKKLELVFHKYIKNINQIVYKLSPDKSHLLLIQTCAWNIIDFVMVMSKEILKENEKLPSVNWFKKEKKYRDRKLQNWEQICSSESFYYYSNLCGGLNKIRKLIGHKEVTKAEEKISDKQVIENLKTFFNEYRESPSVIKHKLIKIDKKNRTKEQTELIAECTRILNHIFYKFENSSEAYVKAGISNIKCRSSKYSTNEKKINKHSKYKEKIVCECGTEIVRDGLTRHKKTKKHRKLMKIKEFNCSCGRKYTYGKRKRHFDSEHHQTWFNNLPQIILEDN